MNYKIPYRLLEELALSGFRIALNLDKGKYQVFIPL